MDDNMSDQWIDRLSEYIDGDLTAEEVLQIESHLKQCDDCRDLLVELNTVVSHASNLKDEDPVNDLWQGISERIETSRVVEMSSRARRGRVIQFSVPQLAAAAVALIVLSGGMVLRYSGDALTPSVVAAGVSPAADGLYLAGNIEGDYQNAIADLEGALEAGQDLLEPETIRVLEESLEAIDQAIQDARRALAVDPGSEYLSGYLTRTLRQKLTVLEHGNNLIATASL